MSGPVGRRLSAALEVEAEQAMSEAEFVAMRAYTGPLFEKYNTILRAANAAFFASYLVEMGIHGNRYATTNHVLSAAICKLSKLTTVETVYRAPGRAMPNSFWKNAKTGLAGIIETGCLSTSSDREVAMQYARRSSAKLLFELRLGFVARGADIGEARGVLRGSGGKRPPSAVIGEASAVVGMGGYYSRVLRAMRAIRG